MNSNINKFSGKANLYEQYRPKYSDFLLDYLCQEIKEDMPVIADIGCGTGIFTKQLLDRQFNVIGIEPNIDMYLRAKEYLKSYNTQILNTSAENTKLNTNSIDVITIAQALHWFNMEDFIKEAKRIIKDDGRIAVIYNSIDDSKDIIKEYKDIYKRNCKDYNNHSRNFNELYDILFGDNYILKTFSNNQKYTYDEFMGYTFSMSYSLKENDENYDVFIKELTDLFNKYSKDGIIELPINSKLAFGKLK